MADNIKSVSVKIGADTKDFLDGLKKVDKQINTTQKTANALQKGLELEFDESRFVQAQKQVQTALTATEEKAKALREQLAKYEEAGRINTADYEKLQLELAKTETKAVQLEEQLEKISKLKVSQVANQFTDMGGKIESAGQKLMGVSAAAGAAAVGVLAVGKSAAASGASLDDMAQRTQISVEKIQELSYVAMQTGVEQDQLQKAIIKTRAVMADFALGTENTATKALQQLGIDISSFSNSEEAFDGIISALSNIDDLTLQAAAANEIFGDRLANNLIPYINAGDEALEQFKKEFAEMPSLSAEQAEALAGLDDTFNRLTQTLEYQKMQLGVALIPVWESLIAILDEKIMPAIESLIEWFSGLTDGQQQALLSTLGFIAVLSPLLIIIGKISTGIGSVIKMMQSLNKATLATTLGFAALGGAITLGLDLLFNLGKMSTAEVILKGLAVAALAAAAAMTVFHASWSMGIAVAAIGAGITAGLAIINAVKKKIMPEDTTDYSSGNIGYNDSTYSGINGGNTSGSGNSYSDTTNNNSYNITVNVTDTSASADEIAQAVSREIATLAQARG